MIADQSDPRIQKARQEVDAVDQRLESLQKEFTGLVKQFLAGWYDGTVRAAIRAHSEKVKRLGPQGLHAMKQEYDALLERIDENIDALFSEDKYWPHRIDRQAEPEDEAPKEGQPADLRESLSDGIRTVQGQLGGLLIKHRFASSEDDFGDWGVDQDDRDTHLRFRREFVFTKEMNAILKQYMDHLERLEALQSEVHQLEEAIEDEQAEDIWENA